MQLSQPLLVYPGLLSLLTFTAICWASFPYVNVLYRWSQSWTESSRCAHTSARWKERITSCGLLATLLLAQTSVWLSLLQGHASDSCSTCSPRTFLQSCFPSGWLPACYSNSELCVSNRDTGLCLCGTLQGFCQATSPTIWGISE